ncbi:MAG: hypothetical protein JW841_18010 [Deltaproteobacteria bacterium]|nr:hypothetical protein [Deltaproteobacteria bacterium]
MWVKKNWFSFNLIVFAILALAIVSCGDEEDDSIDGNNVSAHGKSCGSAPAGSYKCYATGSTIIEICNNGEWESFGSCGCSVKVGDWRKPAYGATCKKLIGTANAIECSYASVDCKQCTLEDGCQKTCSKCSNKYSTGCCP